MTFFCFPIRYGIVLHSCPFGDLLYYFRLQVQLLQSVLERNTVLCVSNDSGLQYLPVIVIKQLSHQIVGRLGEGARRSLCIFPDGTYITLLICLLSPFFCHELHVCFRFVPTCSYDRIIWSSQTRVCLSTSATAHSV